MTRISAGRLSRVTSITAACFPPNGEAKQERQNKEDNIGLISWEEHSSFQIDPNAMNSDAEAASEFSPLVGSMSTESSESSTVDDITKDELDRPWPATFDRGIQILAGPIMDEKSIDNYTKSPGVRARYNKVTTFM